MRVPDVDAWVWARWPTAHHLIGQMIVRWVSLMMPFAGIAMWDLIA